MSKVKLYIARHGKTMFNTIGRAQGWLIAPLTPFGEEGIRELARTESGRYSFRAHILVIRVVERFKLMDTTLRVRRVWKLFLINVTNGISGEWCFFAV